MNFFKGVIFGAAISTGAWMMYSETTKNSRNKIIKQGKKIIKNMGMM